MFQKLHHLNHDIIVARKLAVICRPAPHMHQDHPAFRRGGKRDHRRIGQRGDIIDDRGSSVQSESSDLDPPGIDRNRHSQLSAQAPQNGGHTREFLVERNLASADGPRRFAPDVDNVGAAGFRIERMFNRAIGIE